MNTPTGCTLRNHKRARTSTPPDKANDLGKAMKELERRKEIPECVRTTLLLLTTQVSTIAEENKVLRNENARYAIENKELRVQVG
ncbi:unnamed protein product [Nippostrongylus brasiliensis]|uniref:BHLH domain-containing protein n=1 Tax=Nippostrongylus brasiliensis TaxID=27835 RepID=A0A0N4Y746_NIPBR|nr:unnamed protein product [Nippostrongylus brasiliensis]